LSDKILLVLLVNLVIWHRRASLSNGTQRSGGDKSTMCIIGALLQMLEEELITLSGSKFTAPRFISAEEIIVERGARRFNLLIFHQGVRQNHIDPHIPNPENLLSD
jgi:hypothetical protein